MDVLKDSDCEILYHPWKANVVVDALIRKAAGSPIGNICLRMTVVSPLLDMIKKSQLEGLKRENWNLERIPGQIPLFVRDGRSLLTQCGQVWILASGGAR